MSTNDNFHCKTHKSMYRVFSHIAQSSVLRNMGTRLLVKSEDYFILKNVLFCLFTRRSWGFHHMIIYSNILPTLLDTKINNKNLRMKLNVIYVYYYCLKFKIKESTCVKLNICLGTWPSRSIWNDNFPKTGYFITLCPSNWRGQEDLRCKGMLSYFCLPVS